MVFTSQADNTKLVLDNVVPVDYQIGMSPVTQKSKMKHKPNFLAAHREAAGMPDHELARLVGTSQPQINRLENGQRKLTIDWLKKIASALKKEPEDLLKPPSDGGTTSGNHPASSTYIGLDEVNVTPNVAPGKREVRYPRKTLPIYGRAAGGREGKFVLNGEKVGEILRPPSLEAVVEAYCVEAVGDSMSPVIEEGYKLYVNPSRPYRRGHLVVVQIRTDVEGVNEGYAKRFISFSSKELVLEQENPPPGRDRVIRFPAGDVVSIHRIVGVEFD
ncbi:XRE family transcriptional regulator [Bradyrhizobium sp. CAR08]